MTKQIIQKAKGQESKKLIAFPIQLFDEDGDSLYLPSSHSELHVIPTGEWDHNVYGKMKITTAEISEFKRNFDLGLRKDIPITAGHEVMEEQRAVGWFRDLVDKGEMGLFAIVEWTQEGLDLLKQKSFKYFSPEYYPEYEDPQTGKKYSNVLVGGALTNRPFFKELQDVVVAFSEPRIINQFSIKTMTELNEILEKSPEELTEEEKATLRDNESDLTEEQREQFALAFEVDDDSAEDGDADEDSDDEAGDDASDDGDGDEGDEAQEHSEKKSRTVLISASELKVLKEKADQGHKAFSELEEMKVKNASERLVFSESNAAGRFAPKQGDAVNKFMLTLSEKQRDQFTNLVNNMPEASLFSEIGDGGKDVATSSEQEVESRIEKIMADDNTVGYSDALRKVFKEDPKLAKQYEKEKGFAA